jgi:hypothetical protein
MLLDHMARKFFNIFVNPLNKLANFIQIHDSGKNAHVIQNERCLFLSRTMKARDPSHHEEYRGYFFMRDGFSAIILPST